MKTWRVRLTARGRNLALAKAQRSIFQGDALSSLLFIIAMMPLKHIPRKCAAGCKLSKSQENINHLMYMDIKLFAKYEKELEFLKHAVRIYTKDIGREFGIEKCAMLVMKSYKWGENEVNIQRVIFLGDMLFPLLFVLAMMPLNHILRKCTGGYKLHQSQEKINHYMYIDAIKLFAQSEK